MVKKDVYKSKIDRTQIQSILTCQDAIQLLHDLLSNQSTTYRSNGV